MARRLIWSPEAADDLEDITAFIARDSPSYARAVARKVLATTRSIQQFPDIGRVVPELNNQSVRERFVYSYRVIYKIEPKRELVVAILHGKRLIGELGDRVP
ncbi:MAG: type II toxin-antitoxin system RelE/ParE family toxin [Thiohalocapsa sp.]|uniref:type II toxin-antitoxin system RelE/ParE family toxin n=1 Tax=Thiohalocapsa sp. TaxID=2497641 RepID=UPI0025DD40A8|nr:type II toxin-antitoxin system RelE/ParE family toxin [Thiohalocapsa sp.]MCG6940673.1 type II toxin-antitoxin system RelE/ParE family toxin [Thiohalocapsa sp.]